MKKILLSSVLFLSLVVSVKAQFVQKSIIDQKLNDLSSNSPLPTFIVGGIDKGGVFYQYQKGNKIWDKQGPISDQHIFRIYSMTKTIATVAALQLVEQGKLKLDEPLDKLMPEMAEIPILTKEGKLAKAKNAITLRQLLSHTAGFGYPFLHDGLDQFSKHILADYNYKDLPRVYEAGTKWQYGTNIDWVGKIIEKVSGTDLETFVRLQITKPLGMNRTFFSVPDSLRGEISTFGQLKGDHFEADTASQFKDLKVKTYNAGGGLFSTFHDYAQFIRCILNNGRLNNYQMLQKTTVDAMFDNQIGDLLTTIEQPSAAYPFLLYAGSKYFAPNKFGLGWAIDQTGRKGIRNPGTVYWSGIANTYFSIDRKSGIAFLFLSNTLPAGNAFTEDVYYKAEGMINGLN